MYAFVDFFRKKGVAVMRTKDLFQLIVDPYLETNEQVEEFLANAESDASSRNPDELLNDDKVIVLNV